MKYFDILTNKLPKNVGNLCKIIVATGFEKLPKGKKSPNLVTLERSRECEGVRERELSQYLLQFFLLSLPLSLLLICEKSFSEVFDRANGRESEKGRKWLVIVIVKILLAPIKWSSMRLMRPYVKPLQSISSFRSWPKLFRCCENVNSDVIHFLLEFLDRKRTISQKQK